MKIFKQYSNLAIISMLFILTVFTAGCGGSSSCDETKAAIITTIPVDGAIDVAFDSTISGYSDTAFDSSTVNETTFRLMTTDGSYPVEGVVTSVGDSMVFTPTYPLVADTEYTATITTGVIDTRGTPLLGSDYVWSFTTGTTDDTPPTVILTSPDTNETNVSINSNVSALLSEALEATTVSTGTFTLVKTSDNTHIAGSVTPSGSSMVFNPDANLDINTTYTATITTGVTDLAGNPLAVNYVWNFTTGTTTDDTPPTVISTSPDTNETGVSTSKTVSALLSERIDSSTVIPANFTLVKTSGGTPIVGSVTPSGNSIMLFNPNANLAEDTEYTATITTGVTDLAGNALAADYVWNFTTDTIAAKGPKAVDLGTAEDFVILAKTKVSTTGTTDVTGDVGVSPAARTYLTGFGDILSADGTYSTSSLVTGKLYAADMTPPTPAKMTTAVSAMETAYTDAAGRTVPAPQALAADITNQTIAPGLYKTATGVLISAAGVTLNGGANDVWIFQIAGDLTMASNANIYLTGGAQAKNVFWQVGGLTGVIIETSAKFKGIALAQKAINVNTGATVEGRLLAQSAVTLDANEVTQP